MRAHECRSNAVHAHWRAQVLTGICRWTRTTTAPSTGRSSSGPCPNQPHWRPGPSPSPSGRRVLVHARHQSVDMAREEIILPGNSFFHWHVKVPMYSSAVAEMNFCSFLQCVFVSAGSKILLQSGTNDRQGWVDSNAARLPKNLHITS